MMQRLVLLFALVTTIAAEEPVRLRVDLSKPDGTWDMPALALGQGGLQGDPMIEPHIKELRQLRPRTIRLFLSEYYRIYPERGRYDWTRLDRELRSVRATGARPILALAMKPPVLYPKVDHFIVHPSDYDQWECLCEALARHCRDEGCQVAGWEVCNEPDIGEMGGTPHYFRNAADYNQFYSHTVAGLLRGDPDARVGGPTVASADSFLVEGLIEHCATNQVPLHFLSWHLYSDSPAAHAGNVEKQRARLAKFPQLKNVKLFISEWNMDLMRPNLAPGFQPCFVLETMRRFAEAKLDMAAYYHIRDCFVDPADFDWMSPGGRRFMAHWWNTMPQYSACSTITAGCGPRGMRFGCSVSSRGRATPSRASREVSVPSPVMEMATSTSSSGDMKTGARMKWKCGSMSPVRQLGAAGSCSSILRLP